MFSELSRLNEEQLVFLGSVVGAAVAGLTILGCVIALQWRKLRQAEFDLAVKEDLLDDGLSVEEIERLLKASKPGLLVGAGNAFQMCCRAVAGICRKFYDGILFSLHGARVRRTELELAFKKEMIERGLSVSEIERLIAARRPGILDHMFRVGRLLFEKLLACLRVCFEWCSDLVHRVVTHRQP